MPRKPFINSSEFPFHITARCINKEWFHLPMPAVWTVMENYLYFIHHEYKIILHAFVLMTNHFHLIATAPEANISEAMNYFMRETSRNLTEASGRINQTYGSRFFRTLIESEHYYQHAYKYVYRNPVEAGLTNKVEDYPYSTLHGLMGRSHTLIPTTYDDTLFSDLEATLNWLNQPPQRDDLSAVQSALRKRVFKLPRSTTYGQHPLSYEKY
ncbi:MAG: transposase [Bdellovibrionales bacterium]|nr:transposase [Bdellovibrionales bacterium]